MGIIDPELPTIGEDNADADADVLNALTAILNLLNGGIDSANIAPGAGITKAQLATAVQGLLVPVGAVLPYSGAAAPSGYLLANGAAVSRTGPNADLFALYNAAGLPYGAGDGSSTFNVPDLRGRAPWGKGTVAIVDAIGKSDGLAVGSRQPRHQHTIPGHSHGMSHTHNVSGSTGGPTSTNRSKGSFSDADLGEHASPSHGHNFGPVATGGPSNALTDSQALTTDQTNGGVSLGFITVEFIIKL
jgi:microcystin-dependent protein